MLEIAEQGELVMSDLFFFDNVSSNPWQVFIDIGKRFDFSSFSLQQA